MFRIRYKGEFHTVLNYYPNVFVCKSNYSDSRFYLHRSEVDGLEEVCYNEVGKYIWEAFENGS